MDDIDKSGEIDEYIIISNHRYVEHFNKWAEQKKELLNGGNITHERSREYASHIIEAIVTNKPYKIGGNVINNGLIPNLPAEACVEVPCLVDANGITPSTKAADWAEQKTALLHKAEELLLTDMPVIPVIFNENAVLVHDDLSKTNGTFYIPTHFQKTKLKDYEKYSYLDKKGESISIFAEFPTIEWDKASK
mgnify:CR=1 FL=1